MPVRNVFANLTKDELAIIVNRTWAYEGFIPSGEEFEGTMEVYRQHEIDDVWADRIQLAWDALNNPFCDDKHPLTENLLRMREEGYPEYQPTEEDFGIESNLGDAPNFDPIPGKPLASLRLSTSWAARPRKAKRRIPGVCALWAGMIPWTAKPGPRPWMNRGGSPIGSATGTRSRTRPCARRWSGTGRRP